MYNEGNVFVQFVWLGESLSYILYLKGAEDAHFDFSCYWKWCRNDFAIDLGVTDVQSIVVMPLLSPLQPLMDDAVDTCSAIQVYWPFSEAC